MYMFAAYVMKYVAHSPAHVLTYSLALTQYLLAHLLTHQVYLADDGTITGEHASECILPSTFGLTPATLTHGNRAQKA